jgi:ComF family protein
LPFQAVNSSSHLCGRCSLLRPPFSKVHCVGLYDLALRKAIHQFKFNQRVGLDRPLAKLLARVIADDGQFELIVPLPLHPRRLRQRCYNQSQLLAKEIGRLCGLPVASRLLLKQRDTPPQQSLSARDREVNLRSAFGMSRCLSGERVLLVDDVMTTGATASAAGRMLLQGGAGEVQVAVVGRAPSESP